MGLGQYWYNGLKTCLAQSLKSWQKPLTQLELSFNIDGLLYEQFQDTILVYSMKIDNTVEISNPMILAIYMEKVKPNLQQYLDLWKN
ncbi:hypothetical protein JTB14_033794 [Gonioctena quinquepunctata]|nr:hypothetical protein JTB14_033794 [Gonioctena quinquepunctata]